jgi:hypothetical protein
VSSKEILAKERLLHNEAHCTYWCSLYSINLDLEIGVTSVTGRLFQGKLLHAADHLLFITHFEFEGRDILGEEP